jgi:cation diffusion facilitator family transporter
MHSAPSVRLSVYAALAGNLLVAITKAVAALWTGSSAMLSEAVHSFVDTGNEVLLLYGMRRSHQPRDREHPVGYGRELYFWSFIVSLLVFALGAGVSVVQGIAHVRDPQPIESPQVSYVVLALSMLIEGASFIVSLRQFSAAKGPLGFLEAVHASKDPPAFMVLFEDGAALAGLAIAAAGTWASATLGWHVMDGVASILIGTVLGAVALLLARESKSLLIGERADRRMSESILGIVRSQACVLHANGLLTVQLAPDQVVAALSLQFRPELRTPEIEAAIIELDSSVRKKHPQVVSLFVRPESSEAFLAHPDLPEVRN